MKNFENDFNSWLEKNHYYTINRFLDHEKDEDTYIGSFRNFPLSLQWGVIVDFFNENGIYISIMFELHEDKNGWPLVMIENYFAWVNEELLTPYNTMDEARKAAYEKAKEIYEQLTQEQ